MNLKAYNNYNSNRQEVILIVDDIPENIGLLHESLDQVGYVVLVATNSLAAIEIAHQFQPDMILMDGHMPYLDGFECCEQLKASPLTQNIPIIFITGLTETTNLVKGFKSGGVDYITKPFNIDETLIRIETHLNHAKIIQQQQDVIDASAIAILALDQLGQRLWETSYAKTLLDQSQLDMTCFDKEIKQWFEQVKLQPQDQRLQQYNFNINQHQFQLVFLTPWSDPKRSKQTYLIQICKKYSLPQPQDILKNCQKLTPREAEVMHWLILGKTDKDIADILDLSPRTVNKHLEHIFEKLAVETRTAAVSLIIHYCKQ